MLDRVLLTEQIKKIFEECPGNAVPGGAAIYEDPLVGIGAAADPLFEKYKEKDVIGPWYMTPEEWLPGAKTVISLFFPFSEIVKASNRVCAKEPSAEWLYARIEGQMYLNDYMGQLGEWLSGQEIGNCVPGLDKRFQQVRFGSNWSERHTAYACGLGTFGLSKGLITEKGMAGRFASVIIDAEMAADSRPYTGVYDYCTMCGACVRRCPVGAISQEKGKEHSPCNDWLDEMKERYAPRYGCGLCQTKVPCESQRPGKR